MFSSSPPREASKLGLRAFFGISLFVSLILASTPGLRHQMATTLEEAWLSTAASSQERLRADRAAHAVRTDFAAARNPDASSATPVSLPAEGQSPVEPTQAGGWPVVRISFNRENDLWRLAVTSMHSTDETQLLEALVASRECHSLKQRAARLQQTVAALDMADKAPRAAALDAALLKCRGFIVSGTSSLQMLMGELSASYKKSTLYSRINSSPMSHGDIEYILSSGSGAALEQALLLLAERWARSQAIEPDSLERDLFRLGAQAAACDLGKDCGRFALQTQVVCAETGQCRSDLWSSRLAQTPENERRQIQAYRRMIVAAVRSRNFSLFDLPAR